MNTQAKIAELQVRAAAEEMMGRGQELNEKGMVGNPVVNNGTEMLHYADELEKRAKSSDINRSLKETQLKVAVHQADIAGHQARIEEMKAFNAIMEAEGRAPGYVGQIGASAAFIEESATKIKALTEWML